MDTTVYPNTYPTYYDSAYAWYDATIISTPCLNYNLGMGLMVLQNGNGNVSGTINGVNGPLKSVGTPLENVHVLLVGLTDNQVYGFDLTNATGQFVFSNIAEGDYKIVIDAPGLYLLEAREVSITANNLNHPNQNYLIGDNVIIIDNVEEPLSVDETILSATTLFPNPANDIVHINFTATTGDRILKMRLADMSGKVLIEDGRRMKSGLNETAINISHLAAATYLLAITVSDESGNETSIPYKIQKVQ
jgi:uncharacterized surface anchored protein